MANFSHNDLLIQLIELTNIYSSVCSGSFVKHHYAFSDINLSLLFRLFYRTNSRSDIRREPAQYSAVIGDEGGVAIAPRPAPAQQ